MTDQVTSIEQSKRLIELGVPADKASMVWATCSGKYHLSVLPHYKATPEYIKSGESIPAFTVADLLEVLPKAIWDDVKGWSLLVIRFRSKGFPRVGYEAEHGIIWSCGEVSLLGYIIETIDWVITSETQIICKGRK